MPKEFELCYLCLQEKEIKELTVKLLILQARSES